MLNSHFNPWKLEAFARYYQVQDSAEQIPVTPTKQTVIFFNIDTAFFISDCSNRRPDYAEYQYLTNVNGAKPIYFVLLDQTKKLFQDALDNAVKIAFITEDEKHIDQKVHVLERAFKLPDDTLVNSPYITWDPKGIDKDFSSKSEKISEIVKLVCFGTNPSVAIVDHEVDDNASKHDISLLRIPRYNNKYNDYNYNHKYASQYAEHRQEIGQFIKDAQIDAKLAASTKYKMKI